MANSTLVNFFEMKKILFHIFLLLPIFSLSQNNITISGYVDEAESGEKLIGATIYDSKSGKGTITNDYGFFIFDYP